LIAALRKSSSGAVEARSAVLGTMPTPSFRQHASALLDAWAQAPDNTGPTLALALESALSIHEHERDAETLDLVATGPSSPFVSIRHTKAVLLEVIDRAKRELIVVSYAAYKVPALVSALERARQRSVVVRLILESTADSAGALTRDGAAAFESLRDSIEMYVWPIEKRPAGSRLHAKVAVADAEFAFITSANLTGHALDQNLEVGVLISGGQAPRRLMDHFQALIARGTLKQLRNN
jgi:phosphatidylserine/phosphatidylglycerophosphate/cardiolipin synthase-like enzyme